MLGYSQRNEATDTWEFHRPRRLPEHLSDVYHVNADNPEVAEVVRGLIASQLGSSGLRVGELLAGESPLEGVGIYLPTFALSHHIGVFGRTGCGKSNLMMVFLKAILDHNQRVLQEGLAEPKASIFAIDPHNEFWTWHAEAGGADGIRGVVQAYGLEEQHALVAPFAYLTAKNVSAAFQQKLDLSRADVTPPDLASIMEFSEQQVGYCNHVFHAKGEGWVQAVLMSSTEAGDDEDAGGYLPGTVSRCPAAVGLPAIRTHPDLRSVRSRCWPELRLHAAGHHLCVGAWAGPDPRHHPHE
ncbi:helicase HerA domain-containing protein [uncultured Draconibacterium sp.]|uniref:helicase HerA domain-containing protein n=1 Tax=uncultured Draconibacterium sp. TaxID=1573823 RepID=UPI0032611648